MKQRYVTRNNHSLGFDENDEQSTALSIYANAQENRNF